MKRPQPEVPDLEMFRKAADEEVHSTDFADAN